MPLGMDWGCVDFRALARGGVPSRSRTTRGGVDVTKAFTAVRFTQRRRRPLRAAAMGMTTSMLVMGAMQILAVVGPNPSTVAAAASNPTLAVAGDISCGPTDPNFNGGNGQNNACMEKATANLIHRLSPNYLLPGGDTQYDPSQTQGVQPSAGDYTSGYGASWGQLQGGSLNVPGMQVYPSPGDHEYGDVN